MSKKKVEQFLEGLEKVKDDEDVIQEFADVSENKDELIGWGIYIPEKEAVILIARKEDEKKAKQLIARRQESGRGDVLVPIFKPHAGVRV